MHTGPNINPPFDRRFGSFDRRCIDVGPPQGWCERRRLVERRLPEVEENAVTEREWFRMVVKFRASLEASRSGLQKNGPSDISE